MVEPVRLRREISALLFRDEGMRDMWVRSAIISLLMIVSLAGVSVFAGRTASPGASDPAWVESLWIADTSGVHRVSLADGAVTLAQPEAGGARAVAVDPARATAWVWTGRNLLALGFDGSRRLTLPLDLPETVQADLAVRPEDGSVWLAAGHELRSLSASGALLASWRLPETIVTLALDPAAACCGWPRQKAPRPAMQ